MTVESLRDLVAQLSTSATALTLLAAQMEAKASGRAIDPAMAPFIAAVLQKLDPAAALDGVSPEEIRPLLGEVRHFWLLDDDFMANPDRAPGWTYDDEEILESSGKATEGFAQALPRIAPMLEGLPARLEAGGAFLDVGTGVGRLAIAVAKRFPSLRVVAVDTSPPALAIARRNVATSGIQDRIDLRDQAGEDLPDEAAFDLAWIPAPFIREELIAPLLARVRRALKPGGWLLFASTKPGDDLRGAVLRFRIAQFGGRPRTQAEVEALLGSAGFTELRVLPGPPRDFKMIVAARVGPKK